VVWAAARVGTGSRPFATADLGVCPRHVLGISYSTPLEVICATLLA
jgi:hypothetical protein